MSVRGDLRRLASGGGVVIPPTTRYLIRHGEVTLADPRVRERMVEVMSLPHYRKPGWHPSSLMGCKRAQVFEFLGMPSRISHSAEALSIFADGTWRHFRWQTLGLASGLLHSVEVPLDGDHVGLDRLTGSADGIGTHRGSDFLFELKGIYRLHADLPYNYHLMQVEPYLMMSELEMAVLLYEDKGSQQLREFIVRPNPTRRRVVRRRVNILNDHVAREALPDVQSGCEAKKGQEFKECGYNHVCLGCRSWGQAVEIASSARQEAEGT